jgi:alpha-methylacyl-CoA racemase
LMWSTFARSLRGDHGPRGTNLTDGGRPYYRTYRCADDRFFAVGAIEPRFYARLLAALGLDDEPVDAQEDSTRWPGLIKRIADVFATRPRDYWTDRFAGTDACGAPVLEIEEAAQHPHLRARMYVDTPAGPRIRSAPRLSDAPTDLAPPSGRDDPEQTLVDFGLSAEDAAKAVDLGVVRRVGG